MPAPVVSSISPNFGLKTGNINVVVMGINFNAPTVTVNGLPATVISATATSISILTPTDTVNGYVSLVVTNADATTVAVVNAFYLLTPGLYHQATDVSAELLRRGFSMQTNIPASDLQNWIAQTEARVNGRISLRYTLPVTQAASPQAYNMLAYICTLLTADRADRVSRNNAAADNHGPVSKSFANGNSRMTEGESLLEQVMADEVILIDTIRPIPLNTKFGNVSQPQSQRIGGNAFNGGMGSSETREPHFDNNDIKRW